MSESRRPGGRPLPLLLAYPLLAVAGALTHRQGLSLAALALLLGLLLWPALRRGRPGAWLLWLGLLGAMAVLAARDLAALALDAVPLALNLLLAWIFGRTLRAGWQPLVEQFIEAIEGTPRLAMPGIVRYARQLTAFWAVLLAAQALVLGVMLFCQVPGGVLARLGVAPPWPVPQAWVQAYVHVGVYLLLAAVFVLEYLYRRWHLRHLPHLGLHALLHRLALRWPQLIRGRNRAP
ncbi:xanthomonadin biosynthesis protein [Frateuria sp. STR12]|uniref:xanthomonadin biosynthesis protein n=1 Tax=Frateuria hangzhouensis TaxID=2995589 RepID=UPI0022609E9C|nr:xanthomonadin biosynthesis protein [Frateuria sp. STR12]MCX7513201.1 xanthomonadin biosynthesis protein [Frateuria sp. STR12]